MIEGAVNAAYEAVVTLPLQGPDGRTRDIQAVIDTDYTGTLMLPTTVVADLGLSLSHMGWALLANDDVVSFDVHDVIVLRSASPVIPRPEGSESPRLRLLSEPIGDAWMASYPDRDLVGVPDGYLIVGNCEARALDGRAKRSFSTFDCTARLAVRREQDVVNVAGNVITVMVGFDLRQDVSLVYLYAEAGNLFAGLSLLRRGICGRHHWSFSVRSPTHIVLPFRGVFRQQNSLYKWPKHGRTGAVLPQTQNGRMYGRAGKDT